MKSAEKACFLTNNLKQSSYFSRFGHFYIGDEFCEKCLSANAILEDVYNRYSGKNIKMTLVTPYLTTKGIEKITHILEFIIEKGLNNIAEIVINDWGTLKLLQNYNSRFSIILGRILVSRYLSDQHPERSLQRYLRNRKKERSDYLFPDTFLNFIKERNISRLEFNSYYHLAVTQKQLLEYGLKAHIYYPFIYLSTSRYCSCIDGYNSYFRDAIANCNKDCEEYAAVLTNKHFPYGIFAKGNTYFMKFRNIDDFNELEVDRVIYNEL